MHSATAGPSSGIMQRDWQDSPTCFSCLPSTLVQLSAVCLCCGSCLVRSGHKQWHAATSRVSKARGVPPA